MKKAEISAKTKSILINIYKRRIELGYSQEFVASKLSLSQHGYSKIESGNSKMTIDRFIELADILETNSFELIQGKAKPVQNWLDRQVS